MWISEILCDIQTATTGKMDRSLGNSGLLGNTIYSATKGNHSATDKFIPQRVLLGYGVFGSGFEGLESELHHMVSPCTKLEPLPWKSVSSV
jgi:hypothetical protein